MGELLWIFTIGFIFWVVFMTQNKRKVKKEKPATVTLSKTIGETRAVCPNCKNQLGDKPTRKIKCPHCENHIYKRTRPYDNEPILITEDQIEAVEEQWAIANGQHDLFLKEKARRERITDQLQKEYGVEPEKDDVEWRALNEQSIEYFRDRNYGYYRNSRLEMAKHLQKYSKPERALEMFIEVSYLDFNGPNNNAGTISRPPFTPKNEKVAPGIVDHIKKLVNDLNLNVKEVKSIYLITAKNTYQSLLGLGLAVNPTNAWELFSRVLNE